MNHKGKIILLGIVGLIFVICILNAFNNQKKKKEAFEECKNTAEQICIENNIDVIDISIQYSQKYEEYDVYMLYVEGSFSNVDLSNVYNLVKRIDVLMIDYDSTLLLTQIKLNDSIYELDILNDKILTCDDKEVYTYVSEKDKSMKETLKSKLPYEGLAEEYIGYTKLGEPDEKEYSANYTGMIERARHIDYIWHDSNGTKIAEATVRHWDFKTKSVVDGYVSDIWISYKLKDRNY